MSEKQETVHGVLREETTLAGTLKGPKLVKVFDDRKDARAYAARMNARSKNYSYTVQSCKKG